MEDALAVAGRALYARLGAPVDDTGHPGSPQSPIAGGDSAWAGLFTRPAILALRDDTAGGLPVRALNRACRLLIESGLPDDTDSGGESPDDTVLDSVAARCGFPDGEAFIDCFYKATGWHPADWRRRFGRRRLSL